MILKSREKLILRLKKVVYILFSTRASGLYTLAFAISIAVATFIENDFGTSSAQKVVYRAWWFEILLVFFGISIIVNIIRYKMIQQKKWPILTFHSSVIVILLGAAITRFFGSEGMMHIREGDTTNQIVTTKTFLQFSANYESNEYLFDEEVYFASLGKNRFHNKYMIGDKELDIKLESFVPNPAEQIVEDPNGIPIIQLVTSGPRGREEYLLKYKDFRNINGIWYHFGNSHVDGVMNLDWKDNQLIFNPPEQMTQMKMATQQLDTIAAGVYQPLLVRTLYSGRSTNMVIADFKPSAQLVFSSTSPKVTNEGICAVRLLTTAGNDTKTITIYGNKGMRGEFRSVIFDDLELKVSYGSKPVTLPFSIKLNDFIIDRYPGTNSASSYASEVTLIDQRKSLLRDQRIYMNNILNYSGYRFFQSSYDRDELGTVLSVNHDAWGTRVSYFGYFLLTLGMVLTFVSPKSRFRFLADNIRKLQKQRIQKPVFASLIFLSCFTLPSQANTQSEDQIKEINETHARKFGRLIVQDYRGRMKPLNTLSSEILRKVSGGEALFSQSTDQVMISMIAYSDIWAAVPMIKLGKNDQIWSILRTDKELLSYNDFFNSGYVLQDYVRKAYETEQRNRGTFEKELIKLDERVNIVNMVFSGSIFKLFPVPNHPSQNWEAPGRSEHSPGTEEINTQAEKFFNDYRVSVRKAMETGIWTEPDQFLQELRNIQQTYGGEILPSRSQVNLELWLNKARIFGRLGKIYGMLGLIFLIVFFISVFRHRLNLDKVLWIAIILFGLGFLGHTFGLGIRWYVSGRAPWSNGYESMIYIAWTTVLSGMIFARKSFGGLAATSILASIILMVAGMSWLDPEITPLVPVLRSYWLTIHVSLIAGSYGFLMLGAIIGVINLILMVFNTSGSKQRSNMIIKEMTYTSEITLIAGLIMLSIGTYLGGVWANESWGRYWGWDAKETWALVTILVYTFILHMRFIPGLRGPYAFNVGSLFGFATVMMTYFGVNYYLSGLHSYAAGDPVPIPPVVYYTTFTLTSISFLAKWRNRKLGTEDSKFVAGY